MKQSLRYEQISCRLQVDGLPDVSTGQSGDVVGIITGWTLQWLGPAQLPALEGRREHLLSLMEVVLPYARHLISGVARPFGGDDDPVTIGPDEAGGHQLLLRSSQPDTEPLTVHLDEARLADLVRLLDQLRLDPRLQLSLALADPQPLRRRELLERLPLRRRLAAPIGGAAAVALTAAVALLVPPPPPSPPGPAAPSASPGAASSSGAR